MGATKFSIFPIPASLKDGVTEKAKSVLLKAGKIPVIINDAYIQHLFRPERIQVFYGGSGSGKSDYKATELLFKCLCQKFCRVLFLRKYREQVRDSQFLLFKGLISRYELGEHFHVKESEMDIICRRTGNMLLSGGLDDVDKLKSTPDITDIWIEEPIDRRGSISSTDFTELDRRLRSPLASNHIHLTFNPISKESWIYDYFFRSDSYGAFKLKTTYLDNFYSPPEQIRQFDILKEKKPDEYAVYALGEWGTLKQGLIFPEYKIVSEFPSGCRRWGYGLDWGFYPDPCAVVKCGIKGDGMYWKEVIYENNLTSDSRAKLMKERGMNSADKIAADRNPEAIAELKLKGFPFIYGADKGPGSIKSGIDSMKMYTHYIVEGSPNVKREFDNYSWAIDRRDGIPTGDPVDEYNHAIDAGRYWLSTKTPTIPGFA
jgi:phage terminase large subunit